ncbi:major capsid protein [Noviherbaspirillum sedimenti]|uniref:Major capsid protein n=1 Tax=Noviherbaspirillum sedimenti TaxID=2320865 RepID=A0A3A3FXJ1_9BURK|nr:major capsid protein [Noviherbaspirillum sedimenti]RJG00341.1 major capsid protein [Noviherbaspirillum sedimenti]
MANNTLQNLFGDEVELTASIQKAPFTPGHIASDKLFNEAGIATTSMFIDFDGQVISLIPAAARGGVGQPYRSGSRSGIHVEAVHLPHTGSVLADEVQDRRAFGGVSLETPEQLKTRKLSGMRANIEATIEYRRLGAIKGQILDADGVTVLVDLYSEFGISQAVKSLALATVGSQLLNKVIDAERAAEDALGGTNPTGFLAYAAPDFMDALRAHSDYKTFLQHASPSDLNTDYRSGILVGNTLFKEYREAFGVPQIAPGTAYMMPLGVPDLFLTRFAPADWVETVNTPGLPIYAKAQPMPMDRGYFLEAQSNPVDVCTRPASVIKLTAA